MSSETCGITPGTVRAGCLTDDSSTDGTVKAAQPAVFLFNIFFALALLLPSSAFALDTFDATTSLHVTPTLDTFPDDRNAGCPDPEDMQIRDAFQDLPDGTSIYPPNSTEPIITITSPSIVGGVDNTFDFQLSCPAQRACASVTSVAHEQSSHDCVPALRLPSFPATPPMTLRV